MFNKTVNDKQLTVQLHVVEIIAYHKDQCVLDNFILELNHVFGQEKKLEKSKGVINDYLSLIIDFSLTGKVLLSMFEYLEEIVVEAVEIVVI